ncbi:MAG: hypothetical protein ACREXU_09410, partial [Gammaproteobacteria bacterium]
MRHSRPTWCSCRRNADTNAADKTWRVSPIVAEDYCRCDLGRGRSAPAASRGAAGARGGKERQAQTGEAEATTLLAEATEAREQAASLRTEADTFTAQAQAAETLAAEYRALAS